MVVGLYYNIIYSYHTFVPDNMCRDYNFLRNHCNNILEEGTSTCPIDMCIHFFLKLKHIVNCNINEI